MSQLLERFTTLQLPDAIDAVLLGTDDMEPGTADAALSRYASRLIGDLGAARMRDIAAAHEVGAGRLSNTDLFWLRFDPSEVAQEEQVYLLATEGVMNRLRLIEEHLAAPVSKHLVKNESPVDEGDCALADIEVIEGIADIAPELTRGRSNPLASLYGVVCRRGGEWDVRTRLALILESVRLPYRLSCRFDCDAEKGFFRIDYTAPDPSWLPSSRYQRNGRCWVDASEAQSQMADDYTVRLGALLASAVFGTGVGARRVHLQARQATLEGEPVRSFVVDRVPFLTNTISAIAMGDLSWHERFAELFTGEDSELDEHLASRHVPLDQDTRQLPGDLKDLLHADAACELDVLSRMEGERWDELKEAREDCQSAPMAAVALLEDIVAWGGSIDADATGRFPLYCIDPISRMWIGDAAVSGSTRYTRYSDTAFSARSLLCDLYAEMGEPERAFQQAQSMIQLAPTSTTGYTDAANALFEQDRHVEAVPYLETALAVSTHDTAISWIYYRLAYAYWQSGKRKEGLACYAMSSHHGFPRAQLLAEEVGQLMTEMGAKEAPTYTEAVETLEVHGLVMPFSAQRMRTVATALMRLTEEGFFSIATLLCVAPGLAPQHRDEMYLVARSLA